MRSALAVPVAAVLALAGSTAVGLWAARGRVGTLDDFVVARGTADVGTLTATLVASAMGGWILFSPAEAGAAFGGLPAVLGYAVGSALPLFAFAVVGPRVRDVVPSGRSLTEYVHARYGSAAYAYVLTVSALYMFVFLAAELTGLTSALAYLAGVPPWVTAALVGGAVLVYAGYGGLVATLATDALQALVVLPLLAATVAAVVLSFGGATAVHGHIVATNPNLLSPGYLPGVTFGAYVTLAVLGANLLNQSEWQRVYAARDDTTVRRGFVVAGVAVVPMVLLAGLVGVLARGLGVVGTERASVAFFAAADAALPQAGVLAVVVLAVLLVASSADTVCNALVSLVTVDAARLLDDPDDSTLVRAGRLGTAAVVVAATVVAVQGYGVLTLFLFADLLAAATFPPIVAGLYATRPTGEDALAAAVLGLGAGLVWFPGARAVLPSGPLPAPSYLAAFVAATAVATVLTLLLPKRHDRSIDVDALDDRVRSRSRTARADGGEGSK
ncbi:sodium:solute symporter family transporter [Halobacterium zhouii]|uniref:sodium:solute symporter family transporter n=1 Tax=Halobacterium zhouii TaxID=2902624 RepID=UPI001E63C82E|nr:sodium:proline symporter [Halobacterium zhouii]